jgi:hypothetical protein
MTTALEQRLEGFRAVVRMNARHRICEKDELRQERTCVAILEGLRKQRGVMLADEVGMGKTYVTFGVLAKLLHDDPDFRACIFAPNEDLVRKWHDQFADFVTQNIVASREWKEDLRASTKSVRTIPELVGARVDARVVFTRTGLFVGKKGGDDKLFFLLCWARWANLKEKRREWIFRQLDYSRKQAWWHPRAIADWIDYDTLCQNERALIAFDEVFRPCRGDGRATPQMLTEATRRARLEALNAVLPDADLLVIDEAHRFRNSATATYQAIMHVLRGRVRRMLFLTATPFQLHASELVDVLGLIGKAAMTEPERARFEGRLESLTRATEAYQEAVTRFETSWRGASDADRRVVHAVVETSASDPEQWRASSKAPMAVEILSRFQLLRAAKATFEDALGNFMIRSLRRDKRTYRAEIRGSLSGASRGSVAINDEAVIPFAALNGLLHQMLRLRDRTFIASVKQGATSSFEALLDSAVMSARTGQGSEPEVYRQLLRRLLKPKKCSMLTEDEDQEKIELSEVPHPKVEELLDNVLAAVDRGEKTLVFVARDATLAALRERLQSKVDERQNRGLAEAYPNLEPHRARQRLERFGRAFHDPTSRLWPLLRENYLYTVLPRAFPALLPEKLRALDEALVARIVRVVRAHASRRARPNYALMKRATEQVLFERAAAECPAWCSHASNGVVLAGERILSDEFLLHGLAADDANVVEESGLGEAPPRAVEESIERFARWWVGYPSLWSCVAYELEELSAIDPSSAEVGGARTPLQMRAGLVDATAHFIARSHLRLHLRILHRREDASAMRDLVATHLLDEKNGWLQKIQRLTRTYVGFEEAQRRNVVEALRNLRRIYCISGKTDHESRSRYVNGFNTPFYPEVIIANKVLREGLDLHRECRRLIHYDLEWNPANLEQRVGRLDRVESLVERERRDGSDVKLEIYWPYLASTIDERIYEVVRERAKWFSFMLGERPEWDEESESDEEFRGQAHPLPEPMLDLLTVQLEPTRAFERFA